MAWGERRRLGDSQSFHQIPRSDLRTVRQSYPVRPRVYRVYERAAHPGYNPRMARESSVRFVGRFPSCPGGDLCDQAPPRTAGVASPVAGMVHRIEGAGGG